MAAPVASYVQLPSDTSNTGKKNQTITKVVGSDTVHEHLMVPTIEFTRIGRYSATSTAARAVVETALAITTSPGTFLHMSTASARVGVLRHVSITWSQTGSAVISQTAPIISVQKYTFNVAHSATTLDLLQFQTTMSGPSANVRGAPTGATVTAGGRLAGMALPAVVSTAAAYGGTAVLYEGREHYGRHGFNVEFGPGEGIAVYQTANGTASDTRVYTVNLVWDEIDVS
jgi:hypothetical protein